MKHVLIIILISLTLSGYSQEAPATYISLGYGSLIVGAVAFGSTLFNQENSSTMAAGRIGLGLGAVGFGLVAYGSFLTLRNDRKLTVTAGLNRLSIIITL